MAKLGTLLESRTNNCNRGYFDMDCEMNHQGRHAAMEVLKLALVKYNGCYFLRESKIEKDLANGLRNHR